MSVQELQLTDHFGNKMPLKNIYSQEGKYLSTVSMYYKTVEHETVMNLGNITLNKLGLEFDIKANYPHDGRDMYSRYVIKGIGDDNVKPLVTIRNSYKSGNALKLILGTYTKICSNGAVLGIKEHGNPFKHCKNGEFGDQKSGLFMNEIQSFINGFAGHLDYLNRIKQVEMTAAMIEKFGEKFSDKDFKAIFNMWSGRKSETVTGNRKGDSVHDFYQTATEYFSHGFKSGANIEENKIIRLTIVQKTIDSLLIAA